MVALFAIVLSAVNIAEASWGSSERNSLLGQRSLFFKRNKIEMSKKYAHLTHLCLLRVVQGDPSAGEPGLG